MMTATNTTQMILRREREEEGERGKEEMERERGR